MESILEDYWDILDFFFFLPVFETQKLIQHISMKPATAQEFNGHMWPVAAQLESTALDALPPTVADFRCPLTFSA